MALQIGWLPASGVLCNLACSGDMLAWVGLCLISVKVTCQGTYDLSRHTGHTEARVVQRLLTFRECMSHQSDETLAQAWKPATRLA